MRVTTNSPAETEALGARLAEQLNAGDMVALYGELGAGKTVFTRGLLRALGYGAYVTSPTFTLVNEYRGGRLDAAHFDLYRIDSDQALYDTGFYDYDDGRWLLITEWSEKVPDAVRADAVTVTIAGSGSEPRIIEIGEREA